MNQVPRRLVRAGFLLTRPSSATDGLPVPDRRRVTWRPTVSPRRGRETLAERNRQTAGSGDPRRTKRRMAGLETVAERNKSATKAVGIRGRSRPTLQHAGVMRSYAEQRIRHWGAEPWVLPLFFRALTGPAQSSATFKSRARGSSNPGKSAVR